MPIISSKTLLIFLCSFFIGYYFFLMFSHPQKKKHKIPRIKLKNIEILPNFKIHSKHRTYHIHHWVVLSVVFAAGVFVYEGVMRSALFHGVTIGGILQGLRYKDRFKFRHPRQLQKDKDSK